MTDRRRVMREAHRFYRRRKAVGLPMSWPDALRLAWARERARMAQRRVELATFARVMGPPAVTTTLQAARHGVGCAI